MIIDSSVLIDIDRGSEKYEKIPGGRHSVSSATFMEMSVGVNLGAGGGLDSIRENLDVIPVDEKVAEKAGEITAELKRRGEPIDINDVYIAATAVTHQEPVLTANTKHFEKVDAVEVIDWEEL
jgi:predicted nucleic acid-binding protein